MIRIDAHREGAVITVRVQPGARKNAIIGEHGEMLKLSVSQPPERGKANVAVVRLLSQLLAVNKSRIEVLSGTTSRTKRVLIRDTTPDGLATHVQYLLESG